MRRSIFLSVAAVLALPVLWLALSGLALFVPGPGTVNVRSLAFAEGGTIPLRHTCEGEDLSPSLKWESETQGVKSFAVICEDPDAPSGIFTHLIVYNLPAFGKRLPEGINPDRGLFQGMQYGKNDFGKAGYSGPCPPKGHGAHRYFFRVYALDIMLEPSRDADRTWLMKAMEGHVLGRGELMGKYSRE